MKRTTVTMVVLSESAIPGEMDVEQIVKECIFGDYVLHSVKRRSKNLTDEQMARALIEAGSDPGFFLLDHIVV